MSEAEQKKIILERTRLAAEQMKAALPEGYAFSLFLFKNESSDTSSVYYFSSASQKNACELITGFFEKNIPQQN